MPLTTTLARTPRLARCAQSILLPDATLILLRLPAIFAQYWRLQGIQDGLLQRHRPSLGPGVLPRAVVEAGSNSGARPLVLPAVSEHQRTLPAIRECVDRAQQARRHP